MVGEMIEGVIMKMPLEIAVAGLDTHTMKLFISELSYGALIEIDRKGET